MSHPPPDEESEVDYEPSYDELRAEASVHAKLRAESFQKAAQAHRQKQFALAQYYAQQVRVRMPVCLSVCRGISVFIAN